MLLRSRYIVQSSHRTVYTNSVAAHHFIIFSVSHVRETMLVQGDTIEYFSAKTAVDGAVPFKELFTINLDRDMKRSNACAKQKRHNTQYETEPQPFPHSPFNTLQVLLLRLLLIPRPSYTPESLYNAGAYGIYPATRRKQAGTFRLSFLHPEELHRSAVPHANCALRRLHFRGKNQSP